MGKILDLSVFAEETLDITMPDGAILHIRKPSEAMVIRVLRFNAFDESTDAKTLLEAVNAIVLDIFNSNTDGETLKIGRVRDMPFDMKIAVINAYSAFIQGLQSDPN